MGGAVLLCNLTNADELRDMLNSSSSFFNRYAVAAAAT
jgi:hypothetical protein